MILQEEEEEEEEEKKRDNNGINYPKPRKMLTSSTINPYPPRVVDRDGAAAAATTNAEAKKTTTTTNSNTASTHADTAASSAPATTGDAPVLHRRLTRSEDLHLHILSHAQGQLREHLEPGGGTARGQRVLSALQPLAHQHRAYAAAAASAAPRPRSAQHLYGAYPPHPRSLRSDPQSPASGLDMPSRWWERGLLSADPGRSPNPWFPTHCATYPHGGNEDGLSDDEGETIIPSVEVPAPDMVLESIESDALPRCYGAVSPVTGFAEGDAEMVGSEDEAARGGETQGQGQGQGWRGYVQQRESWVRKAGLKREREVEREKEKGGGKRGRSGF